MVDKKISELPASATITGAEFIPVVQGGNTVRATVAEMAGAHLHTGTYVQYLAAPTGIATTDTTNIQAAFAAGGRIIAPFAGGTYQINAEIVPASNTQYFGNRLTFFNLAVADIGFNLSGRNGVVLDGLRITGSSARAICAAGAGSDITIRNCTISGATVNNGSTYSAGIYVDDATDILIENNTLSGNGIGASAARSADIATAFTGSSRVTILRNRCTSTAAHFNIICFNVSDSKVEKNYCSGAISDASNNSGYGIGLYQTLAPERNTVEGNTVVATQGCGIYVEAQPNCLITGNRLIGCATTQNDISLGVGGISVAGCDDAMITGNLVRNSGKVGISIDGEAQGLLYGGLRNLVAHNNISGSATSGIRVRGATNHFARIVDNVVTNSGGRGIYVQQSPNGVVVESNTVVTTTNTASGIGLPGSPTNFHIDNNIVSAASGFGIEMGTGVRGTISDNILVNNGAGNPGVYDGMQTSATQVLIADNHSYNSGTSNQSYGIRDASAGTGVLIRDNKVSGNVTGGIVPGAAATVADSGMTAWLVDVPLLPTAVATVGTWTAAVDPGALFNGFMANSGAPAQNDEISHDVTLSAGTWSLELLYAGGTNTAIATVLLGGVSIGTINTYRAAFAYNLRTSITGVTVAGTGKKRLTIRAATKDASSTAFRLNLTHLRLTRTA